ncbi:MAG: hypothetical protein JXA30_04665 [Deltaproteobacteria bacterium]|nr:hypothetical protein [Deltaproteobacteria bacterium]
MSFVTVHAPRSSAVYSPVKASAPVSPRFFSAVIALSLWTPAAVGCGSTPPRDVLFERFKSPESQKSKRLSPDLFTRAESAHQKALMARRQNDDEAAGEYSLCAKMLLDAATLEAERVEIERRRVQVERRLNRAGKREIHYRRASLKIEREIELLKASMDSAKRLSFDLHPSTQLGETKSGPRRPEKAGEEEIDLALRRARLYLASAAAMGVENRLEREAQKAVDEALSEPAGSAESAIKTRRALALALDALGQARLKNEGPTRDEVTSFINDGVREKLSLQPLPRGIVINLSGLFIADSSRLSRQGKTTLQRVSALIRAHPHGPIKLQVHPESGSLATRERLAKARAERIISALCRDTSQASRFNVDFDRSSSEPKEFVNLVFVAYARSQP